MFRRRTSGLNTPDRLSAGCRPGQVGNTLPHPNICIPCRSVTQGNLKPVVLTDDWSSWPKAHPRAACHRALRLQVRLLLRKQLRIHAQCLPPLLLCRRQHDLHDTRTGRQQGQAEDFRLRTLQVDAASRLQPSPLDPGSLCRNLCQSPLAGFARIAATAMLRQGCDAGVMVLRASCDPCPEISSRTRHVRQRSDLQSLQCWEGTAPASCASPLRPVRSWLPTLRWCAPSAHSTALVTQAVQKMPTVPAEFRC